MLQNIRDNMQGTMAKVIIGIIIVPFAAFGIDSLLTSGGSEEAATVNGEEISEYELRQAIELRKRQMLSRMGENVDFSQLDDNLLRKPALENLIQKQLMLQKTEQAGLGVSDAQLDDVIMQIEDFQVEGQFSPTLFQNLIRSSGMTPQYYKDLLRSELLISQLSSPMTQGGFVTQKQVELTSRFTEQKRDLRYLTIPIDKVQADITVTDEELQTYYEEHSSQFYSEEKLSVEYIEIKRSDYYEGVTEEQIRTQYEQEISELESAEQRRASHILIEVEGDITEEKAREKLQDIKSRLDQGADFAELAKNESDDIGSKKGGGDLGFSGGKTFPDEFEAALASLSLNQVSEIVETDAGLHLIKLTDLKENEPPSYEENRDRIELQIQKTASEDKYVEKVEQLADISFNSENLADPASELGMQIKTSDFFPRRGGIGLFANQRLVTIAFSDEVLKEGNNSELVEMSDEHSVVLRRKEHKTAALQAFADVKDKVEKALRQHKASLVLEEKADTLMAQLREGTIIQELANSNKLIWQVTSSATRNSGGVDRQILNRAFEMPVPGEDKQSLDQVTLSNGDLVLLSVSRVRDGSVDDLIDNQEDMMKSYLGRSNGYTALDTFQKALVKKADIDLL